MLFEVLREYIVRKRLSVEQRSDEIMARYAVERMGNASEAKVELFRFLFDIAVSGWEELERLGRGPRERGRGHEGHSSLCCECEAVPLVSLVDHRRGVGTDRKVRQA